MNIIIDIYKDTAISKKKISVKLANAITGK